MEKIFIYQIVLSIIVLTIACYKLFKNVAIERREFKRLESLINNNENYLSNKIAGRNKNYIKL